MSLAKYIPLNAVEHENMLRTIIIAHMGTNQGNPTNWVVDAVAEAFQRGFGTGFNAGMAAAKAPPAPPPAFRVAFEDESRGRSADRQPKRLGRPDDNVVDV